MMQVKKAGTNLEKEQVEKLLKDLQERGNAQKDEDVSFERKARMELKGYVYELEELNYRYIVMYRSNQKYWKVGGHSARFLDGFYCPRLKEKVNLKIDTDHNFTFKKDGIISIKNTALWVRRLTGPVAKMKLIFQSAEVVILKAASAFDENTLYTLRKVEEEKRKRANETILVEDAVPELWAEIRGLTYMMGDTVRLMDGSVREMLGLDLMIHTRAMVEAYIMFTHGEMDFDELKRQIGQLSLSLETDLATGDAMKLIEVNKGLSLTLLIEKIEEALKTEEEKRIIQEKKEVEKRRKEEEEKRRKKREEKKKKRELRKHARG